VVEEIARLSSRNDRPGLRHRLALMVVPPRAGLKACPTPAGKRTRLPRNGLVEGGQTKPFVKVTGKVFDVLATALGCVLFGKDEAHPQARRPGVLNL
jgi:hypothetical protein